MKLPIRNWDNEDHRSDGDCSEISSWMSHFNKADVYDLTCGETAKLNLELGIEILFNVPLLWLFEHHLNLRLPPNSRKPT